MDIHNYKRRFERTLERIKNIEDISKQNKELILKFKDYCISEGIGIAKIERYLCDMIKYSRMLKKPLQKASKEDIRAVIAQLEQTNLSAETKKCFKIMLRKLYRFIEGIDEKGIYPDKVRWISIAIPNNHKKLPKELLTEKEIIKIIEKCDNIRDRALISALAESGCRVSEIGTMKIKHICFEKYGTRLTVSGKTGMRKILVINSTPYLQEWLNHHPHNDNPEDYLWCNPRDKVLTYTRITAILKNAAKKAGIKKRVYCHLLRHSRATSLANKMSEAAMKQYFGWTQGSKMAATYIHMSGKDTDEAILAASGIKIEKQQSSEPLLQPKRCIRCYTQNEATNKFCKICGFSLDRQEAEKIIQTDTERKQADELMEKLLKDREVLEILVRKIKEVEKV